MRQIVIDQFMWPFQPHFRHSVEHETREALASIGLHTEVRALLVGFASDNSCKHQVCIEPEGGPLEIQHLGSVARRAEELLHSDPDANLLHSDPRLRELQYRARQKQSRAHALVEAIEQSDTFRGLTFFASQSAPIGGYEVHTCVGVQTTDLDALPAFDDSTAARIYVGRSLQHEVIEECLRRSDRALHLPDAGTGIFVLGTREDIVAAAAHLFTDRSVVRPTGMSADLFNAANGLSSLSYELSGAKGHLTIADIRRADVQMDVRFERPIPWSDSRTMRKLLEITDGATRILANEDHAYGLGTCCPGPEVVEIAVLSNAKWELSIGGTKFLRVSHGRPTLPKPLLDVRLFADIARRTVGTFDRERIENTINVAQQSGRGMTLVISSDPAQETDRLGGEAMTIEPTRLTPELIARLSRVDGAILLGPDGRCHAFGVILDGAAVGRGDRARGSRFNSAVRYQRTQRESGNQSVLVVVSVDGSVDILPALQPRVHRHEVEATVSTFCSISEHGSNNAEEFSRASRRVEELACYLNDEQCQRVNDCYNREMHRRVEEGGIATRRPPLRPAADMDDTYFY